jgi:hypothetical protein
VCPGLSQEPLPLVTARIDPDTLSDEVFDLILKGQKYDMQQELENDLKAGLQCKVTGKKTVF